MPNSSDIVAVVARRLRDVDQTAYSTVQLDRLIDQCQRILNVNQRIILSTVNFTTAAHRSLYQLTAIGSDVARVEMVRQDGRNLFDIPWESLIHQDRLWLRQHGNRIEYFSRIGNDLLVIAPSLPVATTVQVVYTTITPTPTGAPGDIPIPNEFVPMLRDMVEATALLRSRRFAEGKNPMERIKAMVMGRGDESIETQGPS